MCLMIALSVPALAAGTSVVNDNDGANGKVNPTTNVPDFTGNDGIDASTVSLPGDAAGSTEHNTHNATTANTQTIDVQARVHEADADIRYVIDIAWGDMKFVYSRSGQEWNPTTHKYEAKVNAAAAGEWLEDNSEIKAAADAAEGYLDGINNRIVVINHSNAAVNAAFAYANGGASFGIAPGGAANNVVGGFYADNDKALAGAAVLTFPTGDSAHNTLGAMADQSSSLQVLYTGAGRNPATVTGTNVSNIVIPNPKTGGEFAFEAFFAFSGTPGPTAPTAFQQVGTITVTITPNTTDATANAAGGWS